MTGPLRVITSGAQAAALERCLPLHDGPVELAFGSSLGAARDSIPTRLGAGERFDLYFLAEKAHGRLAGEGYLAPGFRPLVRSHIGAAVRDGAAVPDISTPEALRAALLGAGQVAVAASASGIYLRTEVFPALGIAGEMEERARTIYSERVGRVVARGEAGLGFQQVAEILPIAGVRMIGRLPEPFRRPFIFGAALGRETARGEEAGRFLDFLEGPEAAAILRETGLDPVASGAEAATCSHANRGSSH